MWHVNPSYWIILNLLVKNYLFPCLFAIPYSMDIATGCHQLAGILGLNIRRSLTEIHQAPRDSHNEPMLNFGIQLLSWNWKGISIDRIERKLNNRLSPQVLSTFIVMDVWLGSCWSFPMFFANVVSPKLACSVSRGRPKQLGGSCLSPLSWFTVCFFSQALPRVLRDFNCCKHIHWWHCMKVLRDCVFFLSPFSWNWFEWVIMTPK